MKVMNVTPSKMPLGIVLVVAGFVWFFPLMFDRGSFPHNEVGMAIYAVLGFTMVHVGLNWINGRTAF